MRVRVNVRSDTLGDQDFTYLREHTDLPADAVRYELGHMLDTLTANAREHYDIDTPKRVSPTR